MIDYMRLLDIYSSHLLCLSSTSLLGSSRDKKAEMLFNAIMSTVYIGIFILKFVYHITVNPNCFYEFTA